MHLGKKEEEHLGGGGEERKVDQGPIEPAVCVARGGGHLTHLACPGSGLWDSETPE